MRARRRSSIAILAALGAILLLASAVLAKEGATVALTDPIPRNAAPGSTLTVEFTVMVPGDNGPTPMIGSPVFVRLIAPDRSSTEGFGTEDRGRPGMYRAEVVVPAGGIASAEFGLRGSSYTNGQSERSDIMFVVDGQLFTTGTEPAAAPIDPTATPPAAANTDALPIAAVGVGVLLLAGLVLATRRLRPTRAGVR
jgi:hypothetical protein